MSFTTADKMTSLGQWINVTGKVTYISTDEKLITLTDVQNVIRIFKKGAWVVHGRGTPEVFIGNVCEDTAAGSKKYIDVKSSDGTLYAFLLKDIELATEEEIANVEKTRQETEKAKRLKNFISILNAAPPEQFPEFLRVLWEYNKPLN